MSKIAHKPTTLNFECTALFTTWWEVKWSNKYGGDIRETHDRLFRQVFFKSLPKNEELESWKEAISEKNQLMFITYLSTPFLQLYNLYQCWSCYLILEPKAILTKQSSGKIKKEAADALVLQEAAAKVTRQGAGPSQAFKEAKNISGMFSESKTEIGPEAKTRTSYRANPGRLSNLIQSPMRGPRLGMMPLP